MVRNKTEERLNDMKKIIVCIGFLLMIIGAGSMDSEVLVVPYIMTFLGVALLLGAGRGLPNDTI